jgi:hypothetical protein
VTGKGEKLSGFNLIEIFMKRLNLDNFCSFSQALTRFFGEDVLFIFNVYLGILVNVKLAFTKLITSKSFARLKLRSTKLHSTKLCSDYISTRPKQFCLAFSARQPQDYPGTRQTWKFKT